MTRYFSHLRRHVPGKDILIGTREEAPTVANVFDLDMGLACKLGSIIGHCDEFLSDDGHPFDVAAIKPLLEDREVQRWLAAMRQAQLAPLPRRKR